MVRVLKWISGILAVLLVSLVGLVWLFTTLDTDVDAMLAKYGGTDARFADGADGLRVHYRAAGPAGAPVLLLIHGMSSSLHTWEQVVPLLAEDYRVLSLDLPGHGLTGPHPGGDYTAAGNAQAVDAVLDGEGAAQATLIGSSHGGWVAWRYALAQPQRVQALVLMGATGMDAGMQHGSGLERAMLALLSTRAGTAVLERVTPRALIDSSLRASVFAPDIVTDAAVDRYWELIRYPGNRRATLDISVADRQPEMAERVGEIAQPVLLLWGAQDVVIPPVNAVVFAERLPQARQILLEDVGHLPMEEAPARTAFAIRAFLVEQ